MTELSKLKSQLAVAMARGKENELSHAALKNSGEA
jgi:hypothetical protein